MNSPFSCYFLDLGISFPGLRSRMFYVLRKEITIFFFNSEENRYCVSSILLTCVHVTLLVHKWSFINTCATCVICYVLKRISSSMLHFSSIICFIRSVFFFISKVTCTHVNKILDTQYTAKVKHLWNKFAQPMISLNWSWIIIYYLHFIHQFKWTLRSRAISWDRENSTRTESSFELMNKM
jgi:hypothetical protein